MALSGVAWPGRFTRLTAEDGIGLLLLMIESDDLTRFYFNIEMSDCCRLTQ